MHYYIIILVRTLCVCVLSSHPFWTSSSLDVPAGVTQEEGHTGFLIHLPSAVRALIFVARRIQPFLSLVDREVEFCVLRINRSPPVGHFYFGFLVFSEKNPVCRGRTHVPTCQKVTRCRLSYRGRPALCVCVFFPSILDIKFVGRTSRGHTGFLIHLPFAVRALIFVARRIQPFLSLVDREVEFCVLTN